MVLLDDDLLACLSKLLFVKSVSLVVFLYCFCVARMDIGRGEAYVGVLVSFFCCWLSVGFLMFVTGPQSVTWCSFGRLGYLKGEVHVER